MKWIIHPLSYSLCTLMLFLESVFSSYRDKTGNTPWTHTHQNSNKCSNKWWEAVNNSIIMDQPLWLNVSDSWLIFTALCFQLLSVSTLDLEVRLNDGTVGSSSAGSMKSNTFCAGASVQTGSGRWKSWSVWAAAEEAGRGRRGLSVTCCDRGARDAPPTRLPQWLKCRWNQRRWKWWKSDSVLVLSPETHHNKTLLLQRLQQCPSVSRDKNVLDKPT